MRGRLPRRVTVAWQTYYPNLLLVVESAHSAVVSLLGVRMVTFLAELNSLNVWVTHVGNAYLESFTQEKVVVWAGKEFESMPELIGCLLLILKALYGLKSSGLRWHEVLADVLKMMGWTPSLAEPDIWMRPNGDFYEYMTVCVDDLAFAMRGPRAFAKILTDKYGLKLKSTGELRFYLGTKFERL